MIIAPLVYHNVKRLTAENDGGDTGGNYGNDDNDCDDGGDNAEPFETIMMNDCNQGNENHTCDFLQSNGECSRSRSAFSLNHGYPR